MYVYACSPIDFWYGWHPLRSLLIREVDEYGYRIDDEPPPAEVEATWKLAQAMAREIGWEGDIRSGEGPFWIPLPCDTGSWTFAIAWKQDNNGETFVASPFQLTWLHHGAASLVINDKGRIVDLYERRRGRRHG